MKNIKTLSIFCFLVVVIFASLDPLDLESYLLHQIGTVFMLIALWYCNRSARLSKSSFCLYVGFLSIHVIAAHYLYSFVPYNTLILQYFNFDLNQFFGWQRNMFDRFVHFAYGFLLYPFFNQVFRQYLRPMATNYRIATVCLMWVLASSAVYELIEWGGALVMSAEAVENYNGQQGDNWDAHKDMLLAFLGSILAWIISWFMPQKRYRYY